MQYKKGTFIVIPNIERLDVLPSTAQALFLWVCKYADEDGTCFPSRNKLAKHIGKDVKTVDRNMILLEENNFISKTKRKKVGTKENMSNLYQIELMSLPSPTDVATPRDIDVAVTIPNINYTYLTTSDTPKEVSDQTLDEPIQEEIDPLGQLPDKFGKTYSLRLGYVYRRLWFSKYGVPITTINYGRLGKALKTLHDAHSEMQIAVLMFTYFNWRGGSGNDDKEYLWLSDRGFPIEGMIKKVDIMIAYLTNSIGLVYDDPSAVRKYAVKALKNIL